MRCFILIGVLACLLGSSAWATTVMIPVVNGSFENDNITGLTNQYGEDWSIVPIGWTLSAGGSTNRFLVNGTGDGPLCPGGGNQSWWNNAPQTGTFNAWTYPSPIILTGQTGARYHVGHTYTLSAWHYGGGCGFIKLMYASTAAGTPAGTAMSVGWDGFYYHNGGYDTDPCYYWLPNTVWVNIGATDGCVHSYVCTTGDPAIGQFIQPRIETDGGNGGAYGAWGGWDLVTIQDDGPGLGSWISGQVTVQGAGAGFNYAMLGIQIQLRTPGTTTAISTKNVVLDSAGRYSIDAAPGTYDVAIKAYSTLRAVVPNVVAAAGVDGVANVSLVNGDVDSNNAVNTSDATVLIPNIDQLGAP